MENGENFLQDSRCFIFGNSLTMCIILIISLFFHFYPTLHENVSVLYAT